MARTSFKAQLVEVRVRPGVGQDLMPLVRCPLDLVREFFIIDAPLCGVREFELFGADLVATNHHRLPLSPSTRTYSIRNPQNKNKKKITVTKYPLTDEKCSNSPRLVKHIYGCIADRKWIILFSGQFAALGLGDANLQ